MRALGVVLNETSPTRPNAAAVLQEIDRMASVTRQRLAEAEQLVERLRTSS